MEVEKRIQIENCPLCKAHLMELCIECKDNPESNAAKECDVAWGKCNHLFHFHCIAKELKDKSVCPLDNKEWGWKY